MKSNKISFAVINVVAAGAALLSVFLPWLDSVAAIRIDFIRLVSTEAVDPTDSILFSIAVAIFVGTFLTLLGALFSSKYLVVIGWIINLLVLTLWIVMTAIYLSPNGFGIGNFQAGVWIMIASVVLSLVSIFIPIKQKVVAAKPMEIDQR